MPRGTNSKVRFVKIYSIYGLITGLSFFDKDKEELFQVGHYNSNYKVDTVMVAENEVIIGFVAKLRTEPNWPQPQ